jgi:phosphoglycerate dehydrogenase-like enzyme
MIATVRHLGFEMRRMREGGWQSTVGGILAGRTLGLLRAGVSASGWPRMDALSGCR